MDDLLIERQDAILRLTLNRPQRRNALGRDLVEALSQALSTYRNDPDIRLVVIVGAGDRAFCAGADLKERASMNEVETQAFVTKLRATFLELYHYPKVTLAAINGHALGGGLEMALACDLRFAVATAKMGLTETRLAIIPGAGGTQLLPRVVGMAKAKELIFTARPISAQVAHEIGLVNELCSSEELDHRIRFWAEAITTNGPLALEQAKRALQLGAECSLEAGLEVEKQCYGQLIPTADRLEGLEAFAEKRPPRYTGT